MISNLAGYCCPGMGRSFSTGRQSFRSIQQDFEHVGERARFLSRQDYSKPLTVVLPGEPCITAQQGYVCNLTLRKKRVVRVQ